MEPPHRYVRDASASVAHHGDYLNSRDDHGLCGVAFENPTVLGPAEPPIPVCSECQARLPEYHLRWWRQTALAATAELEALRIKYRELTNTEDEAAAGVETAPSQKAPAEPADVEPVTLLDRARRELLDLCRRCDAEVPYRQVKNLMQAFSDRLDPDERVLLAQEIGASGSLLRWSTIEIETLGWRVAGNPLQAEPEEMWDAWTRDAYQTPKPGRWRLGRSRSHDAS